MLPTIISYREIFLDKHRRKSVLSLFLVLLSFSLYAPASQAAMGISPVRVDLSNQRDRAVVTISNTEDVAKSYQAEMVNWVQTELEPEKYSPSDDILVVPPLFTLQPGEQQVVRIGMLQAADQNLERTYRMFVRELGTPGEGRTETTGIKMRVQIGIPVFVAPSMANSNINLELLDVVQREGQLYLQFENTGNTHAKIVDVYYSIPGDIEQPVNPVSKYIHAGQSALLQLPAQDAETSPGFVTIVTDRMGTLEYVLPLRP